MRGDERNEEIDEVMRERQKEEKVKRRFVLLFSF